MPIAVRRTRTEIIDLTDEEAKQVTMSYLESLKKGQWVENGKLREEHYTSHRFDADVEDQDPRRIALIEAIQLLQYRLPREA